MCTKQVLWWQIVHVYQTGLVAADCACVPNGSFGGRLFMCTKQVLWQQIVHVYQTGLMAADCAHVPNGSCGSHYESHIKQCKFVTCGKLRLTQSSLLFDSDCACVPNGSCGGHHESHIKQHKFVPSGKLMLMQSSLLVGWMGVDKAVYLWGGWGWIKQFTCGVDGGG